MKVKKSVSKKLTFKDFDKGVHDIKKINISQKNKQALEGLSTKFALTKKFKMKI